jgi:DNA-binding transcriptional LysR family regulator
LERHLHVRLLDRSGRSIRLTDAGRLLHARGRELFGVERAAERELRELRGLKRGVLRVAASTTIATYLLPPVLGRFKMRHPGVRLHVASANTRTVVKMLLESRVDVALVEGPVAHARVEVKPWMHDELVVIAAPTHPAAGRTIRIAELPAFPFLVREPGSGTRVVGQRALARHGIRLTDTTRIGGTEAIKQAVAAGLGLAIVSRAAAADQIALGKIAVVSVEDLVIRRTLTQIKLRDRAPTAAARELELLLDEEAGGGSTGDASGDSGVQTRPR